MIKNETKSELFLYYISYRYVLYVPQKFETNERTAINIARNIQTHRSCPDYARRTKERWHIAIAAHSAHNLKRCSTVCHSERVNWVPGSWVQMCSRIVIELSPAFSLSLSLSFFHHHLLLPWPPTRGARI